jgi:ATP-dependent DNA helicase PIF1
MDWNPEQLQCIDAAENGESFMLMGAGGTGKSTVLKEIVRRIRDSNKIFALCATTGVAAELVGGEIINSFLGLGLVNADETSRTLIDKVKKNAKALKNWRRIDSMTIEEVSMLGAELFDMLDTTAREVRGNNLPFGGLQLILCGDFFQNCPIRKTASGTNLPPLFAFQARSYRRIIVKHIVLKTIYRQKEVEFQKILTEVRDGVLTPSSISTLRSRVGGDVSGNCIEPTHLYAKNLDVLQYKTEQLEKLKKPITTFRCIDELYDPMYKKVLDQCQLPQTLQLAEGAQVMLLSNSTVPNHINGSRGVVISVHYGQTSYNRSTVVEVVPDAHSVVVRFKSGEIHEISPKATDFLTSSGRIVAKRSQFPLTLAWATTIHKAQGAQLDCVKIDPSGIFAPGMFYVALSRVTSLEGLSLLNFDQSKVKTYEIVLRWYKNNFEGTITQSYAKYLERLQDKTYIFDEETAMDFFVLYLKKYFPTNDITQHCASKGELLKKYLNTYRSITLFECLV